LARRGLCVDRVCAFSLQNFRAVALMHLYENPVQFGPTLSSLPHLLSRLRFNLIQPIQPEKDAAMKEE